RALAEWTGEESLLIDLEGHGREELFSDLDISRTVGWFTTIFPVLIQLKKELPIAEAIKSIKEQFREIPNKGIGYGLLKYLNQEQDIKLALASRRQAEVSFNYLGQFDQSLREGLLFKLAQESVGLLQSEKGCRRYLIDIVGAVISGRLQLSFNYSGKVHNDLSMEQVANSVINQLGQIITHCLSPDAGGYTPSDFPLAQLNQQELDKFISNLEYDDIEDIYLLSPIQQGMLFHSIYTPDSGEYIVQSTCTLNGDLDISAFEQAWQAIVDRHPTLRTSFHWKEIERQLQVVHSKAEILLTKEDWRLYSTTEQKQKLEDFLRVDRKRGFDLTHPPLMRIFIFSLSENRYQFTWSFHHLLLDGWSLPLLLKEFFIFYQGALHNCEAHLEKRRPFRDYIAWLQKKDLLEAERFWKGLLKGFTSPTSLAIGIADENSFNKGMAYGEEDLLLSRETTAKLQAIARQYQLTLSTIIQGAWAILLSRYSGAEDIVFGTTVSGRPADLAEVESMIGLFINTLPVRIKVLPETELLPWLNELQILQTEIRHYEYSPLTQIQRCSELPRGLPLFETIVAFENYPTDGTLYEQGNLQISDGRSIERVNFPITLMVIPGEELKLRIIYDHNRFDTDLINQVLNHLRNLLEAICIKTDWQLIDIPLLSGEVRDRYEKIYDIEMVEEEFKF
ncbi:MAG: condensation domain-containing protein, partial [Acidobacteriota bacterium]